MSSRDTTAATAAAQTPLAKAKRNHGRAKAALANADALAARRKADLEERVRQTARDLREAARREAERAPEMTPEKRAALAALIG